MSVSSSVQFQFNNLPKMNAAMRDEVEKALIKSATVVQGAAIMLCPVISGNLRGSITWSVNGGEPSQVQAPANQSDAVGKAPDNTAVVGTNVVYAQRVEYRKPYLRPALDANKGNINHRMSAALGQAVKGVSR